MARPPTEDVERHTGHRRGRAAPAHIPPLASSAYLLWGSLSVSCHAVPVSLGNLTGARQTGMQAGRRCVRNPPAGSSFSLVPQPRALCSSSSFDEAIPGKVASSHQPAAGGRGTKPTRRAARSAAAPGPSHPLPGAHARPTGTYLPTSRPVARGSSGAARGQGPRLFPHRARAWTTPWDQCGQAGRQAVGRRDCPGARAASPSARLKPLAAHRYGRYVLGVPACLSRNTACMPSGPIYQTGACAWLPRRGAQLD